MAAEQAQFEIYQDSAGQWRWRLRAVNGQIVATSHESYTRYESCLDATALVRSLSRDALVERVIDVQGEKR